MRFNLFTTRIIAIRVVPNFFFLLSLYEKCVAISILRKYLRRKIILDNIFNLRQAPKSELQQYSTRKPNERVDIFIISFK